MERKTKTCQAMFTRLVDALNIANEAKMFVKDLERLKNIFACFPVLSEYLFD